MTVLAGVEQHRAVQPHRSVAPVLKEQLVEVDVLQDEAVIGASRLYVGDADVDGLTRQVLRRPYAVDAGVDRLRAEATVDVDGAELAA